MKKTAAMLTTWVFLGVFALGLNMAPKEEKKTKVEKASFPSASVFVYKKPEVQPDGSWLGYRMDFNGPMLQSAEDL